MFIVYFVVSVGIHMPGSRYERFEDEVSRVVADVQLLRMKMLPLSVIKELFDELANRVNSEGESSVLARIAVVYMSMYRIG